MRPPVYDWSIIAEDFITNNVPYRNGVTLKTIAEKYGIPYQTVRRRAAAEKWHSDRYFLFHVKTTPWGKRFTADLERRIERLDRRIEGSEKRK